MNISIYGDAPLIEFQIHRIASNEDGYNYYLYIHSRGYSIIMRENEAETEYLYAVGGISGKNWSQRASLTYNTYDKLK